LRGRAREAEDTLGRFSWRENIRMSSTLDGKREHSFPWMRGIRAVEYSRRKARTLVSLDAGYSGCRVLSTESENTRFPGCGGFRLPSTLDEKREHSFPWMRWIQVVEYPRRKARTLASLDAVYSGCRVLSTAFEYAQLLLRRLRTDH